MTNSSSHGPQSPPIPPILKIASLEDIPPNQVTPPLYDVIDPEAINALFANTNTSARSGGVVEFQYAGYDISITAAQEISINEVD